MDAKLIIRDIQLKKIAPIYLLHGDEPYYIDEISKALLENVLTEEERAFNQLIVYGKEADASLLISELNSFPVMATKRLVIIKEAQDFKSIDNLAGYCERPLDSTIFVICYKYGTLDARKKIVKGILKNGVVFKSSKIKEYKLVDWITQAVKSKGFTISSKAAVLLAEFLGNDLSKINNELDKLGILLEPGTSINDVHIEKNIGVSKDYNVYELNNAVANKELEKAFKIIQYFEYNPKAARLTQVVSTLFRHFTQIMRIHFLPNKSKESVAQYLKVHPYIAGELLKSAMLYSPQKIAKTIEVLYEYDLKGKGVGSSNVEPSELMKELVFKIVQQ
jgi:DNA polymerase-3 subunit delta